jgi:POLQ-like helicase
MRDEALGKGLAKGRDYLLNVIKKHKRIKELYGWQKECLEDPRVRNGDNVIISLPTSAGKTLVAEYLILEDVVGRKKNALLVLPYNSIVNEKAISLGGLALELGFLVEIYAGVRGTFPPRKRRRNVCYVATVEKALVLVDALLEGGRLREVGSLVVDELHMIGDDPRGAALESLLMKGKAGGLRLLGMSATVGNLDEIAAFMGAHPYRGAFRPSALEEYVKIGDELFRLTTRSAEPFVPSFTPPPPPLFPDDPDGVGSLVLEVLPSHCVLVFCRSKRNCENVAAALRRNLPLMCRGTRLEERFDLARELEGGEALSKCVLAGVAYHHSGLLQEDRSLVEEAFSSGVISVVCCTSTLAAGVNLPARRVVVRSPYVGTCLLDKASYKQMVGRAGRGGEPGESFLIVQPQDAKKVASVLCSSLPSCSSKLRSGLPRLVLSALHLSLSSDLHSLRSFLSNSLLARQEGSLDPQPIVEDLKQLGLLKDETDGALKLTPLGRAAVKSGIEPQHAISLHTELAKARSCLVLVDRLHLLYLVIDLTRMEFPQHCIPQVVRSLLSERDTLVATALGLGPAQLHRVAYAIHRPSDLTPTLKRFALALILNSLVKGIIQEVQINYHTHVNVRC